MSKTTLAVLGIIALLIGVGIAYALTTSLHLPTDGTVIILGLSATWVSDGSNVTSIDWLETENSTEYEMAPMNLTNTSNVPVTLSLSTQDWSPSILALSLTWNYTGAALGSLDWVIVELYQNVTATGDYGYTTVITATEFT